MYSLRNHQHIFKLTKNMVLVVFAMAKTIVVVLLVFGCQIADGDAITARGKH